MSTATSDATGTLVERLSLKTLVESCLVLEDGIASLKDIEIGMMAGAGILPGPFSRADEQGLDDVLAALERAEQEWGDGYTPPKILKRLVGQGRLGKKSGQGFFPYPQPDPDGSKETIQAVSRDTFTEYVGTWYSPERTVVGLAGNLGAKTGKGFYEHGN